MAKFWKIVFTNDYEVCACDECVEGAREDPRVVSAHVVSAPRRCAYCGEGT